jgi:hypothetical protein
MHTYNLSLPADLQVRLMLPYPVFDDICARMLLGAYVPGVKFAYEPLNAPVLTVAFRQSDKPRVVRRARQVTMYDTWKGQASLLDFIHLTYTLCRLAWLQKGLYVVHSSCVGDLLLVGHSGVGKTSTALRLAAKGGKVFSGNKTLIEITHDARLIAIAGTQTITAKAKVAEQHMPALGQDKVEYFGRNAYVLEPGMYSAEPQVELKRIALVHLNNGADSVSELEPLSGLHRLHPFFLDAQNADAIVCGGKAVYPGTLSRKEHAALAARLLPALEKLGTVLAVTGSMPFVETALEVKKNE